MPEFDDKRKVDKCVNLFLSLSENDKTYVFNEILKRRGPGNRTIEITT